MTAAELKRRVTTEQLVARLGFEIRSGKINCPFHRGDNSASLHIYQDARRGWYCFGCHRGGTVIDFLMEIDNITFSEAFNRLADMFGIDTGRPVSTWEKQKNAAAFRQAVSRQKKTDDAYDAWMKNECTILNAEPWSDEWCKAVYDRAHLEYLKDAADAEVWARKEEAECGRRIDPA